MELRAPISSDLTPVVNRDEAAWFGAAPAGPCYLLCGLWAVYLAFPLHCLRNSQFGIFGFNLPLYYLFTVPPALALAGYAMLRKVRWSKEELVWWTLPCLLLGSIACSMHPAWSLRELTSWMVRGFAVGGAFLLFRPSFPQTRRIVSCVYCVTMAAVLLGFWELYVGYNPFAKLFLQPIPFNLTSRLLPMGTQGNRVAYAACVLPFLPVALWKLQTSASWRWIHGACAAGLFTLLLLSQVRSSWVGLFLMMILYTFWNFREGKTFVLSCLLAMVVLLAVNISIPQFRRGLWARAQSVHVLQVFKDAPKFDISIGHRIASYATLGVLRSRWLYGAGYGEYPDVYGPYYRGPNPELTTPDNQYLRWIIETGVFGFGSLAAFFTIIIGSGWRAMRRMRDPEQAALFKALLCGWVGIAATFIFFDGFYWGACNMTFWSFLGLFATCI